jgi:hypothetical protein
MATFTAFISGLRPGNPGSADSITYSYPVYADVIVMDSESVVQPVADSGNAWDGFLPLCSIDFFEVDDTVATLRVKLLANVRPQYPQIAEEDTLHVVWLDAVV